MAEEKRPTSSWVAITLSDTLLRGCLIFTIAFTLMPPEGIGFELCASKRLMNAPCPGCGMTRCGSNLVRGNIVRALQLHALGVLVIPVCILFGIVGVLPRRWREAFRSRAVRQEAWLRPLGKVAIALFFAYGLVRMGLVILGTMTFPSTWPK